MKTSRPFFVERKWSAATDIVGLLLVPEDGTPVPAVEPGAHIELHVERPGHPPLVRHYSLCNGPRETNGYFIAVKLEPQSRGGSRWVHDLTVGDLVNVGDVRNLFPLVPAARKHILLGAGIGITPLLAMAQALLASGSDFELHYFARATEHVALKDRLHFVEAASRLHVHIGKDAAGVSEELTKALAQPPDGVHVYHCGPGAFMDTVEAISSKFWPTGQVHSERFQATQPALPTSADTFVVRLHKSGISCNVEAGQSITEALAAAGHAIDTSCEQGVCGTCLCNVIEGTPEHLDAYLSKAEKADGKLMLPCVSRSRSPVLVLDL